MSSPLTPTKFSAADYTDVGGILTYLDNVGGLLAEILSMADLTGIKVHGPATELEKFKKSPPQSGVVRDRVKLRHLIDHWLVVIGIDNDNQSRIFQQQCLAYR